MLGLLKAVAEVTIFVVQSPDKGWKTGADSKEGRPDPKVCPAHYELCIVLPVALPNG